MVDTGTRTVINRGDFFDIPPWHDGNVDDPERGAMILFGPPDHRH